MASQLLNQYCEPVVEQARQINRRGKPTKRLAACFALLLSLFAITAALANASAGFGRIIGFARIC